MQNPIAQSDLPSFVHFFDLTNDVPSATLIGPNKTIDPFLFPISEQEEELNQREGNEKDLYQICLQL